MVQDITSHAKSVCVEKLENTKLIDSNEVRVFFSMVILVPIITMLVLVLIVRSTHEHIHARITGTSEKGYQNLVGLTLAGITVMIYILTTDVVAVHYYRKHQHEYSSRSLDDTVNLFSPAITFILDLIVTIPCLTLIIYLWSLQDQIPWLSKLIAKTYLRMFIVPYFYIIFGSKAGSMPRDIRDKKKSAKVQKAVNVWAMTGVAVAPFFCFSSHAGYILMAWVTDPVKTTAVFFIGIGCCLYLFFMFRQCYTVHAEDTESDGNNTVDAEDTTDENYNMITLREGSFNENNYLLNVVQSSYSAVDTNKEESKGMVNKASIKECLIAFTISPALWVLAVFWVIPAQVVITARYVIYHGSRKAFHTHKERNIPEDFLESLKPGKTQITALSYKGLMIAFGMSWLIIAPLALVLSSFFLIPVSTYILAQYLESTS